jgi:lysophospholipase L1-like esterase
MAHSTDREHRLARVLMAVTAAVGTVLALPGSALASPTAGPRTVVAIGDSIVSGEAAGAYDPATDRSGNFCHRSTRAYIQVAPIAGTERRVNLACSGATTAHVALNGAVRYGEAPQAQRLRTLARTHRVTLVTVTIGANDVDFAGMVLDCAKAYFLLGPRCQETWNDRIPSRIAAMAPRLAANLADIRSVMRAEGYADSAYQLVVQSYSSPITEDNRHYFTRAFEGCPFRLDDSKWARDTVVPQYTATMGRVAAQAGARFLDMGPALRGREVCARGIDDSQEWVKGITIDVAQIRNGLGPNIVQQSLHPNALGHAQFGRCLAGFAGISASTARCVRQPNGNLAAVPVPPTAMTAAARPGLVPTIAEPPLYDRETAYRLEAQRDAGR